MALQGANGPECATPAGDLGVEQPFWAMLPLLYPWRRTFFLLEYGTGAMRIRLPGFMSPFQRPPEFLGHSGLSGAFAFYAPAQQLYLAGIVNQLITRSASFRLMLQLAQLARKLADLASHDLIA